MSLIKNLNKKEKILIIILPLIFFSIPFPLIQQNKGNIEFIVNQDGIIDANVDILEIPFPSQIKIPSIISSFQILLNIDYNEAKNESIIDESLTLNINKSALIEFPIEEIRISFSGNDIATSGFISMNITATPYMPLKFLYIESETFFDKSTNITTINIKPSSYVTIIYTEQLKKEMIPLAIMMLRNQIEEMKKTIWENTNETIEIISVDIKDPELFEEYAKISFSAIIKIHPKIYQIYQIPETLEYQTRIENLTKIIQKLRGIDTKNKLKNINFDFLFSKNKYVFLIKIKAFSEGNVNVAINRIMKVINEIIKEENPKVATILAPLLEETEFYIKRMNFSIEGINEKFRLTFKNLRFKPKMQGTQEEFYFSDFVIAASTLLNKTILNETIKDVNFTIKGNGVKISTTEGMPTPISISLDSVTWNEFNIRNLYFLRFSKIATTTTTTAPITITELPISIIILILIIIIVIIISIFFFMKRKKSM